MTKHYKQLLLIVNENGWGKIATGNGNHWLINKDDEVARLPHYLWLSIVGYRNLTHIYGPFKFYNGFEKTKEADYLKSMLQYKQLTATAFKKVSTILEENQGWVDVFKEFAQVAAVHIKWIKEITDDRRTQTES